MQWTWQSSTFVLLVVPEVGLTQQVKKADIYENEQLNGTCLVFFNSSAFKKNTVYPLPHFITKPKHMHGL